MEGAITTDIDCGCLLALLLQGRQALGEVLSSEDRCVPSAPRSEGRWELCTL